MRAGHGTSTPFWYLRWSPASAPLMLPSTLSTHSPFVEQLFPMDPISPLPAELGTEEAISFPLLPNPTNPLSPPPTSQRREIFVRRRVWGEGGTVITIIERSSSTSGNTDTEWTYLNLETDFVLPLHAASEPNRSTWKVRVGYLQGAVWTDYPFRTGEAAFRFQQLVTGYKPVGVFENVTCLATYTGGFSLRRPQYAGVGTVQVWWGVDGATKGPSDAMTLVSSRSSNSSRSSERPQSIASIQTNSTLVQRHCGQPVLVVQVPRPPLLVAFLKDKRGEMYATLKVDIVSKLTLTKITREKAILMLTYDGSTFHVDKHTQTLSQEPLAAWNLCNPGNAKGKSVNSLKCEYLSLDFGSGKDLACVAKRDELHDEIQRRKLGHMNRNSKLGKTKDAEVAELTQAMRAAQSPPPLTSMTPPPELPIYDPQPWISTDFITSPYGDPRFGIASVKVELAADKGA